jgi:menaquinone-dependent protoporphyrinogen oxidase
MHILIIYGSVEGQTHKIAERIAEVLRNQGQQVTTLSGERVPADFSLDQYDAAIVGGAIYIGKYPKYIKTFVSRYRDRLNSIPSAFYTVCMGIRSQRPESREEALQFGPNFFAETGWQPKLSATFAGAVKYTQYNFITRFIMKRISKKEGGSTDTSRDHEYTDWASVERFADEFVQASN